MIPPDRYGIVELGFTTAIVLGFGLYQIWSVRRSLRRDRDRDRERKDRL